MAQDIDVLVREVGLRDGLQNLSTFVPTEAKLAWIRAEFAAGVREIEVTSFVPPKLIPQFADAEQVAQAALAMPGLTVMTLVPNLRGAERAFALGVHKVDYVVSVSRTHNLKNVRREREESLEDFKRIVAARDAAGLKGRTQLAAGLSTALGCSYEGRIAVDEVRRCAAFLAEAGAEEIMVADTVGYADPWQVREVFEAVLAETGKIPVAAHFHDTRGTGLANVAAAIECGIRRFDASLGGLGGCPFAPGASGNIVMEDLCFMLDSMGLRTGVDLGKLLDVRAIPAAHLGADSLTGALAKAGLPRHYQTAAERAAAIH
ncbi:hydroxymethylglutaryl-CoA lyase [Ramlibacter ginsenosidimutans]|uniref:Hydroxymethylglutaryl-CoA lyase n=1 Tax=Ramlibacter ginsenosidimutans TaxID=502333 RepID=A0A934TUJ1_9BURK|nr:hydroxymethylglutaryl-CoA lyase [Ramlibacter ginsenosidimutans]MBK6007306.1 hydroxymethylglutaryl-CoA lyase [Ramlibacter ginsenosidimutans]